MRYSLSFLILIPVTLGNGCHAPSFDPSGAGSGRGFINPPTVAEMKEIQCLATMVYGEARGEKKTGQVAVAYSALNRTKGKKSLCEVVLAPKQYSVFNNNPTLRAAAQSLQLDPMQKNPIDKNSWQRAQHIADIVFRRKVSDPTNGSTHYVAYKSLKRIPYWTTVYHKTVEIGNHTFFKQPLAQKPRSGSYQRRLDA